MQRSSYGAATRANIGVQGDKLLANIETERTTAEGQIHQRRQLESQQLFETLARLQQDYARNVEAHKDELRDKDYERTQSALQYGNDLMLKNIDTAWSTD